MKAIKMKLAAKKKNKEIQAQNVQEEREAQERGELPPSMNKKAQCLMSIVIKNGGNLWATTKTRRQGPQTMIQSKKAARLDRKESQ